MNSEQLQLEIVNLRRTLDDHTHDCSSGICMCVSIVDMEVWGEMFRRLDNAAAKQETINRLEAWVRDLQAGCWVNCVYCGHRYGPTTDTPQSQADILRLHIESCPDHPMSKLKTENADLRAVLRDIEQSITQSMTGMNG